MRVLRLKPHEDRRLRAGHLWIFANEVEVRQNSLTDFTPGEAVTVCDSRGAPLGSACVNPASLICARLHSRKPDVELDKTLLTERLASALALRERIFDSTWYRLCHGEGDFLPGLVIDRYGDHLTVQISTAAMEQRRPVLESALCDLLSPTSILWDNDLPARVLEGLSRQRDYSSSVPEILEVPENGCIFAVPCLTGQKTGWFYDQRVNRAALARYADGADILDVFSYAGGFGVTAAAAGARSVTFIDASAQALDFAMRNMAANAPHCQAHALFDDAFVSLQQLRDGGRHFQVISLDPPAFIKRRKDHAKGLAAYRKLNALAADLLAPGGFIASSSCSHHLEAQSLRTCLTQAAVGRKLHPRLLYAGGQGPDHPIHSAMPETAYLKCFIVQVNTTS
ncbi:MAG: class I SAM-dependent rRNA methyltransferase [Desulfovibrio sp.]|nr:class I SAM-dependent rRNA methyltransferase [Desulfovibrio sp.]